MKALSVGRLQTLVDDVKSDEKAVSLFREEVARVFGPTLVTEGDVGDVAADAEDRLNVLERTGRASRTSFNPVVAARLLSHKDENVRRFVAKVIPESHLRKLCRDASDGVRSIVALRASRGLLDEMIAAFPNDEFLLDERERRMVLEAGIPQPKINKEPVKVNHEKLGDAGKQDPGPELSEQWYIDCARQMIFDYGRNIEDAWEEQAVHRYASSLKATSRVEIDEARLVKAIKKLVKEREDRVLEKNALKETVEWLRRIDK